MLIGLRWHVQNVCLCVLECEIFNKGKENKIKSNYRQQNYICQCSALFGDRTLANTHTGTHIHTPIVKKIE